MKKKGPIRASHQAFGLYGTSFDERFFYAMYLEEGLNRTKGTNQSPTCLNLSVDVLSPAIPLAPLFH